MIDPPAAAHPLLEVRALRHPPLEDASLVVAAGECVVIAAPSGAGKSLLLRAIADLDPHAGQVRLGGVDRAAIPAPAWRQQVGYLPAVPGWWAATVGEHMADRGAAAAMLPRLGLPTDALTWPVARLSTGERQRLSLIRAIIGRPRVLLLDEPTAALDSVSVLAVEDLLAECLATAAAILIVSHDPAQISRLARRRLTIIDGRLRELPNGAVFPTIPMQGTAG
jgi:ABC-type iron transport system FetAB ATPase subunit